MNEPTYTEIRERAIASAQRVERRLLTRTFKACHWSLSSAALSLKLSIPDVVRLLERHPDPKAAYKHPQQARAAWRLVG